MNPDARYHWIEEYLRNRSHNDFVDVLNRDFVDDYARATGVPLMVQMYGAAKCPTLGRDLAHMAKNNRLRRSRSGIEGMAGMGFPRWVWIYRLP
jgi:hypothetical protein